MLLHNLGEVLVIHRHCSHPLHAASPKVLQLIELHDPAPDGASVVVVVTTDCVALVVVVAAASVVVLVAAGSSVVVFAPASVVVVGAAVLVGGAVVSVSTVCTRALRDFHSAERKKASAQHSCRATHRKRMARGIIPISRG